MTWRSHKRSGARHLNCLRSGSDFQLDLQIDGLIHLERDTGDCLGLETVCCGGDGVRTHLKERNMELASAGGYGLASISCGCLSNRDLCVGNDRTASVLH